MKRYDAATLILLALIVLLFAFRGSQFARAHTKVASKEESKFQTAQRNLTTAIANLEAYLQANPRDKDATVARIQLKGLNYLMPSAMAAKPVEFKQPFHNFNSFP